MNRIKKVNQLKIQPEVEVNETEKDLFEDYFEQKIVPLVEEDNLIKERYRNPFWGYVWSIIFLCSVNVLIALFNSLMNNHPISYEQLILFTMLALSFIFLPIRHYYREARDDIFDVFLQYYGDWKHKATGEVQLVHSPIIPAHDSVGALHNITNDVSDVKIEIRDTFYKKKSVLFGRKFEHIVSSGIIVYLTFPIKFDGILLMFDKTGFYRKKKYSGLEEAKPCIDIPAANYFSSFTDNVDFAQKIMMSLFFETILDMKEAFAAKNMYLQIQDNYIRIYFEGSVLYFDSYKFWSNKIDKKKFLQMNLEFEKIFNFIPIVEALIQ